MSRKHPIISVTGSSGAGRTTVKSTFDQIFRREGNTPVTIEGDAFHRYDRAAIKAALNARKVAANELDNLKDFFRTYGATGKGETHHRAFGAGNFHRLRYGLGRANGERPLWR